jgi:hypothetical protein
LSVRMVWWAHIPFLVGRIDLSILQLSHLPDTAIKGVNNILMPNIPASIIPMALAGILFQLSIRRLCNLVGRMYV